ncbi:MAG TPA: tetratricopeptide repeat protein [Candidatus Acidoferrum sp.]
MTERMRVGLLLAISLLVYANTLTNGFALDDSMYILNNPRVTHFTVKGLFDAGQSNGSPRYFRPLTFATFAGNWAVGDAHAFGYHLINLLLHAGVTLLLYLLLRKILESFASGTIIAWTTALLFAVHPIHTEAVASIVGRSELLAAGLLLAAWLFHLDDHPVPALLCFALALLSKESAIAFVPLVFVGDYVRGQFKPVSRYASIIGVAALYVGVLWRVQGGQLGVARVSFLDNPLAKVPANIRILNALRIAGKYVALQIYPATLSSDYSYNAIRLYASWRPALLALAATMLILALWIGTLWMKRKEWFLAGAIYLAGFAVTANLLLPTGTIMGERLAYLPSAGFCLAVALLWARLERTQQKLAWAVLAAVVIALGVRTMVRNRDWRDNFALFSADVRAVPGSAKMHFGLGEEYLNRGELQEARAQMQTGFSIFPDDPDAVETSGLIEGRLGNDQEARRLLQQALAMARQTHPHRDFMVTNLTAELIKIGEKDEALQLLDHEIAKSPINSSLRSNRAVVHYLRGETDAARADAQTALQMDPANQQAAGLLNQLSTPGLAIPQTAPAK